MVSRAIWMAIGVAVLAGVSLWGCDAFQGIGGDEEVSSTPFSHKKHVTDEGIDCDTCHDGKTERGTPGMPVLQTCMGCHEDGEKEKVAGKRIADIFFRDGKPLWAGDVRLSNEVTFSHEKHVGRKTECGQCHQGIKESVRVTRALRVTMDGCLACHGKQKDDCSACHKEIRQDRQPPSHRQDWKRGHGAEIAVGGNGQCAMCHSESSCVACHQEAKPADHNASWRHRTHGVMADVDRSRCATCHRTDYCQRCHEETAPRTHTATWFEPLNRHCNNCHLSTSAFDNGCGVCHKPISHETAPVRPSNGFHVPTADCLGCHTPLEHRNNGDSCVGCH